MQVLDVMQFYRDANRMNDTPRNRTFPAPRTRDPIVNTNLLRLWSDRKGVEHFWISTYNRNVGCTGLRVDEWGNCKTYHFPWQHEGFYSAVHVGGHTLWLCGRLDRVVRLDLKTGRYQAYDTGAAKARVFEGMIHDDATGKIFVLSQPFHTTRDIAQSVGVSFDIRKRRTVKLHEVAIAESVTRCSFPNGDGSHTMNVQIPGEALVRWDPARETVTHRLLTAEPVLTQDGAEKRRCRLIGDDHGRWYMPRFGWFDPARQRFDKRGPTPPIEMAWFARLGNRVFGALNEGSDISVHEWDWDNGRVSALVKIPDCDVFNVSVTRSGRLVAVNAFGIFQRFDIATGSLEATLPLPTENFGDALAVGLVGDDQLIGTPYVSSRFWTLDLRTGESRDCGRVQTAWGQVSAITRSNGKAYLAAYGSGELMEYDAARPLCFPENPRRVADPPGGMRPVAIASDNRHVFYSCANDYGRLGCVVTRYDTGTGRAHYAVNPLVDQQIVSISLDERRNRLVCGTTYHADSMSQKPTSDTAMVAILDAASLRVVRSGDAPKGVTMVRVAGRLDAHHWLCSLHDHVSHGPASWMTLDDRRLDRFSAGPRNPLPTNMTGAFHATKNPGRFVLNIDDRIELWDMCRVKRIKVLFEPFNPAKVDGYLFNVLPDDRIVVLRSTEVVVAG